jgi:3-methyladenine DNA glycosylase Tag
MKLWLRVRYARRRRGSVIVDEGKQMPGKAAHTTPLSLTDFFEALTKAVFGGGISMAVVEARWGGLTAAFEGFDPVKVARFTPTKVDELMQDARMVRNRRKIEATVDNAAVMVALDGEHGGFANYLRAHDDHDQVVEDLGRRFSMLDYESALLFLRLADADVPALT